MKPKKIISISTFLIMFSLFSCGTTNDNKNDDDNKTLNTYGEFDENDYLKVDGNTIVNKSGENIILKGVNAGGYLVIEQWMTALKNSSTSGYLDHKKVTNIFLERFGEEKTLNLWEYYRENFWTEDDFINCKDMGMNVIRLPFSYMNVDPNYYNVPFKEGETYNFDVLDEFILNASKYGLYTILDMHGAYGSQNGQDHSGEIIDNIDDVDFYSNTENKEKTKDLWVALTNHYKNNPSIAAFDLLNEPGEKASSTSEKHWEYFDELYDSIRNIDEDRIIIFESCWDGNNLPTPSTYGWENCIYSFHHYSGETQDYNANLESFQNKIDGVNKMNFNVPYYMGEFTCYGIKKSWELTLDLLNSNSWSYTFWTYKLNRVNSTSYPGWGIYYSKADPVIPDTDSYDEILEKWYRIDTNYEDTEMMKFDEISLFSIIKEYL